jgi:hypothetical protein
MVEFNIFMEKWKPSNLNWSQGVTCPLGNGFILVANGNNFSLKGKLDFVECMKFKLKI